MNYTTEDAIALSNTTRNYINLDEHDRAMELLVKVDPELLALTLVLSTMSR